MEVRIKGFAGSEDAEDQVKQLGHDGTDDDDRLLALGSEAVGESLAGGVVTHGAHGRVEECFAQP